MRRIAVVLLLQLALAMARTGGAPRRAAQEGCGRAPEVAHRLRHQMVDEACPRFVTMGLAPHGAGHFFFDLVAGIDLAQRLNATYVLDIAPDLQSSHGPDVFDGLLDVLNFKSTEHGRVAVDATYRPTHVDTTYDDAARAAGCNTFVTVSDTSCSDPKNERQGELPIYCQYMLHGLYQRMRPMFLTIFLTSPLRPRRDQFFNPAVVNIAWHVRTGDIDLLSDAPAYFENVHAALAAGCATLAVECRHHVFSSMGAQVPPRFEFLTRLEEMTFYRELTFVHTVLAMTTADVVVESGSSMTAIVRMLTSEPTFVTPCPKEGCGVATFETADGIFANGEGIIDAGDVQRLHGRMQHSVHRKRVASCGDLAV